MSGRGVTEGAMRPEVLDAEGSAEEWQAVRISRGQEDARELQRVEDAAPGEGLRDQPGAEGDVEPGSVRDQLGACAEIGELGHTLCRARSAIDVRFCEPAQAL